MNKRSNRAPVRRAVAIGGGALALTALMGTSAMADGVPQHRDPGNKVGNHVPATKLAEPACGVPSEADDDVLVAMKQVADEYDVSARVRLAMHETAWVESHANNLDCGDRDSLGVFQQRPSAGWGTEEQIMDVGYATTAFLERAIPMAAAHPEYSAGEISQAVQVSAFPDRYDESEGTATDLMAEADALTGDTTENQYGWRQVSEGEADTTRVRVIQRLLRANGHDLEVDASFGPATSDAVAAFQSAEGLEADGVVGIDTWSALAPTLESGSTGEAVYAVQEELNAHGYEVEVTGTYDDATASAVESFREAHSMPAGSTVDRDMWQALTFLH